MGRQRDPKRDEAYEIYKASGGEINLNVIAAQLGVGDGTVRGWKAKDGWDSGKKKTERNATINGTLHKKKKNAPNNTERSEKKMNTNIERKEPTLIEIENDELTDKQRLFCIYYVKIFNATQAAIKAGYASESAHVEGSRLLSNAKVSNEVKRLKSNMTNALYVEAMDVLNKYVAIAFADIKDYVDFGQEEVLIFTKKGAPIIKPNGEQMTTKQSFVALKNASEVDGTIISEVKEGKDGVSVKLIDKMKALEVLNKYFDLLPDTHKRKLEDERLKIDRERLELDKARAAGEGDLDEELIDDWVGAVMDDGGDKSGDQ